MATFASATFDAARYAAARPTYPKQLYDFIFDYHRRHPAARFETALDLGCGTGKCHVFYRCISFYLLQARRQLAWLRSATSLASTRARRWLKARVLRS